MIKTYLKALIVDDEVSAVKTLTNLLTAFCPEIVIVGTANNVDEAIKMVNKTTPNVVFLDIEMPKKSGFELLKYIDTTIQVVFVTAYNKYAIKAFDVSAVDYLLKPVLIKRLKQTVEKLKLNKGVNSQQFEAVKENIEKNELQKFVLPHKNTQFIISTNDIICLEANAMYTKFYFYEHKKQITKIFSGSLKNYIEYLEGDNRFFRIHRSWLVHKKSIVTYKRTTSTIILENNLEVPLSRNSKRDFQDWLDS